MLGTTAGVLLLKLWNRVWIILFKFYSPQSYIPYYPSRHRYCRDYGYPVLSGKGLFSTGRSFTISEPNLNMPDLHERYSTRGRTFRYSKWLRLESNQLYHHLMRVARLPNLLTASLSDLRVRYSYCNSDSLAVKPFLSFFPSTR
jgi:hypothetical protein